MKTIINILIIALTSIVLNYFLPFWCLAVIAFVSTSLLISKPWVGFISGFMTIFIIWFVLAYYIDASTHSILTERMSKIFHLSHLGVMALSASIGGFVTGISAATGAALRSLLVSSKRSNYYNP